MRAQQAASKYAPYLAAARALEALAPAAAARLLAALAPGHGGGASGSGSGGSAGAAAAAAAITPDAAVDLLMALRSETANKALAGAAGDALAALTGAVSRVDDGRRGGGFCTFVLGVYERDDELPEMESLVACPPILC